MTEIAEAVAAIMDLTSKDKYCDKKKESGHGWTARIDSFGSTPTAEQLYKNMKAAQMEVPAEPKKVGERWSLADCGKMRFPFQSHHLIPKKHLPKHGVCVWLTEKWTKDPKYKLSEDNNFDTDHARNGYFMPFVSNCDEWKKASGEPAKQKLAEQLMQKTGIQLHQGSHTAENYAEEVEDIETGGYLTRVDQLLGLVQARALVHVRFCDVCKTQGSKIEVQPLESVVNHVYTVAMQLKLLIDSNRIFVSERAAEMWKKNPV